MKSPSIIFMGTPEFAVPALKALHDAFGLAAVVSVPDKQAGRGRSMQCSAVSREAEKLGIPLYKPQDLRDPSFISSLASLKPDIIVVIAFRILPREVYSIARLGSFNIHGSLLPKYRGAAPIQWAIINGEQQTGLTSFLLNDAVDTGSIVEQIEISIDPDMTSGELFTALMNPAAELAIQTCNALLNGNANPISQDDTLATPAPKIFRDTCKIDWNKTAVDINNLIRGANPKPGAWTTFNDRTFKILKARINNAEPNLQPGSYIISDSDVTVGTGNGLISLLVIQEEGKPKMPIADFLRGYRGVKEGIFS
ncbi:methionyl-tRNA formyltransferase [bacterium]|nr:methionyl-tRNA formyltransferase [bacterium]